MSQRSSWGATVGVLAAVAGALALPGAAGAAVLAPDSTAALSGTPDLFGLFDPNNAVGVPESGTLTSQAVSANGTKVVFASKADGLVPDDDNAAQGVYVKDLGTRRVQLVSRRSDSGGQAGAPNGGTCHSGTIDSTGTKVAFLCDSPLDAADQNGFTDVYVRDLAAGTTRLVSLANAEEPVVAAFLADDGSVVFSTPSLMYGGGVTPAMDFGGVPLTYRANPDGTYTLISKALLGIPQAGGPVTSISADGTRVVVQTPVPLVNNDGNGVEDVYLYDTAVPNLLPRLVSHRFNVGQAGDGASTGGKLSPDGTFVAFASTATDVALPPNGQGHAQVYGASVSAANVGQASRISEIDGALADRDSTVVAVGDAGAANEQVAFHTSSTNLGGDAAATGPQLYVASLTQDPELVSRASGATGRLATGIDQDGAAFTRDGTRMVFGAAGVTDDVDPAFTAVVRRDLTGAETTSTVSLPSRAAGAATDPPLLNSGDSVGGSVSADGGLVAFASRSHVLGAPLAATQSVYVRDVSTGTVSLVSRDANGAPLIGIASDPQISGDGSHVAFVFTTGVANAKRQVFVFDRGTGTSRVASHTDGGPDNAIGNGDSFDPSISDDGSRVAFVSVASNLVAGDSAIQDVFVHDSATNATAVANIVQETGVKSNLVTQRPAISGDGRSVVFDTGETLTAADTDILVDVYLRSLGANIKTGTTSLVSLKNGGQVKAAGGVSFAASIDRNGTHVAFMSLATNLLDAPLSAGPRLYVRDIPGQVTTLAGVSDGGVELFNTIANAQISGDGTHVAFESLAAQSIAPGDPGGVTRRVFVRDLMAGTTRLISRAFGPDGAATAAGSASSLGGVSADATSIAFSTKAPLLPAAFRGAEEVYVRTTAPRTPGTPGPGGPGAVPPGGPGAVPPRVAAPVVSRLSIKAKKFRISAKKKVAARISFSLDRAAAVTLTVNRVTNGRKQGRKCVAKGRKGARCTIARSVGRVAVVKGVKGTNKVSFSGKVGKRKLARGSYQLVATPQGCKRQVVTFTVI